MRHLDLFSGIGTWALASKEVWPDREMVGFCEIDPFCQAVLKKHFPNVPIYADIRTLAADTEHIGLAGTEEPRADSGAQPEGETGKELPIDEPSGTNCLRTEKLKRDTYGNATDTIRTNGRGEDNQDIDDKRRKSSSVGEEGLQPKDWISCSNYSKSSNLYGIDLLTASPPCQAASSAGKRKGTDDARWLWPATIDVLGNLKPRWCILENVLGLLSLNGGLEFDKVCADVEAKGYEVWPVVLPASAVNAPHQRYRVWIIGRRIDSDADSDGRLGRNQEIDPAEGRESAQRDAEGRHNEIADDPNAVGIGRGGRSEGGTEVREREMPEAQAAGQGGDAPHADLAGIGTSAGATDGERQEADRQREQPQPELGGQRGDARHSDYAGLERCEEQGKDGGNRAESSHEQPVRPSGDDATNPGSEKQHRLSGFSRKEISTFGDTDSDDTHSQNVERERGEPSEERPRQPEETARDGSRLADRSEWDRDWRDVAYETCLQVEVEPGVWTFYDGPPDGLLELPRNRRVGDKVISHSKWRQEALKAVGNGIVGQVAVELMKAIKEADDGTA
jgi:site-specific DNA-cytosine methylase